MLKWIKVYGERNTNTNYMSQLIRLNLRAGQIRGVAPARILKLKERLKGREWVIDLYFVLTFTKNLGWKHSRVKSVAHIKKSRIIKSNPCFITITKNPYAWLFSLYRKPYHQFNREKTDFETFLRTPWKTVGRDNCARWLNNPIELWNFKNASYLQLQEINALSITSEQMLIDPGAVVNQISSRFSIEKKAEQFVNYERSTKNEKKNFNYYKNYYLMEKWKENLSTDAISTINATVDKDLMDHFGYGILS